MPNEEKRLERIEALVSLLQTEIATWRKEQGGAGTSGRATRKGLSEIEIAHPVKGQKKSNTAKVNREN